MLGFVQLFATSTYQLLSLLPPYPLPVTPPSIHSPLFQLLHLLVIWIICNISICWVAKWVSQSIWDNTVSFWDHSDGIKRGGGGGGGIINAPSLSSYRPTALILLFRTSLTSWYLIYRRLDNVIAQRRSGVDRSDIQKDPSIEQAN